MIAGLRPRFVAPELDPQLHIAHCMTPEALDRALAGMPDILQFFAQHSKPASR